MLLGRWPVRAGRSATKQGTLVPNALSQAREGLRQCWYYANSRYMLHTEVVAVVTIVCRCYYL